MIDLKQKRPNRSSLINETNEALWLYFGGRSLKNVLKKWSSGEDDTKFLWRQTVTIENYRNYPREVLRKYEEGLARSGSPTRSSTNTVFQKHLDEYYSPWFGDQTKYALLLPEIYVQFSYPPATGEVQTEQDRIEVQGLPHATLHFPQHVWNYCIGADGRLDFIALEAREGKKAVLECYDRTNRWMSDTNGKQRTVPEPHGFNRVPFLRFAFEENDAYGSVPPVGHAFMADVLQATLGALEFTSMLVEAGHIHLNLKLVTDEKTKQKIEERGLGNTEVIPQAKTPDATNAIQTRYLETPSTEITVLERLVYERKADEIYEIARLRRANHTFVESGAAKEVERIPEDGVLTEIRNYFYWIDSECVAFMAEAEETDAEVTWPEVKDGKTLGDVAKDIAEANTALADLPRSRTADNLLAMSVLRKALPSLEAKDYNAIMAELSAMEQATTNAL